MMWKKLPACICWAIILGTITALAQTPVVLDIPEPVVTLSTRTVQQIKLTSKPIKCSDGARVFMRQPISPAFPCGNCFAVYPEGQNYALYFLPGQGQLSYKVASIYTVTVQCTDGATSDSRAIQVRLLDSNSPPTFVNPAPGVGSVSVKIVPQTTLDKQFNYQVQTADLDNDAILYRMNKPDSEFFEIGYVDGKIRATKDLRFLCQSSVEFSVTALEARGNSVEAGPTRDFRLDLTNGNTKPTIKGDTQEYKEAEHTEDSQRSTTMRIGLTVNDATTYTNPQITWRMRAEPEEALQYYTLTPENKQATIKVDKSKFNYEYKPLRSVTLYVDASDGFCDAETYSFTVDITDVNEPPTVFPFGNTSANIMIEGFVYEGHISFRPNITATDPDEGDELSWTLDNTKSKPKCSKFAVDSSTGVIISTELFDIDNEEKFDCDLVLTVADKAGLSKDIFVKLTILNRNEHPPEFSNEAYESFATECTKAGKSLRRVQADDLDYKMKDEGLLVYNGTGTQDLLAVTSNGDVILKRRCIAGEIETIRVNVMDSGPYPGPMSGIPSTLTFVCNECPTTTAIPVTTPVNSNNNDDSQIDDNVGGNTDGGNGGNDDGGNNNDGNDFDSSPKLYCAKRKNEGKPRCRVYTLDNMNDPGYATPNDWNFMENNAGWIIVATLVTAVFLALLVYMLWQYCWKGLMAARPVAKRTPKPIKVKSQPKPQKQQPPPEQQPPPPPPPELQPYNEPRLFGFWKETFPDRDQRQMPQRDVIPMNVAQDSKIDQKNKMEEKQEKEQWREERQQQMTQYQQEMQSYSQRYGGQAADTNAFWYTGTTGQAIRGGTGEEIAPNRQWDTKPAGGEYSSTLRARFTGQSGVEASTANEGQPSCAGQSDANNPHAFWYTD